MKAKHITKQFLLGAGIFIVGLVMMQASASASILDIDATGDISLDTGFTFGPVNGGFSVIGGATPSNSTYVGNVVTGVNPGAADFNAVGDGFSLSGNASATDEEFAAAIDFNLDLTNTHATEAYEVKIRVNLINNSVNADGTDAYAKSEFTINDSSGEIFFSDLLSDSLFGDEAGGTLTGPYGATGTLGDPQSESGILDFTYILNAGDTENLTGAWVLEGGDFATGLAEAEFNATVTILDVSRVAGPGPNPSPVPEPGTLLLFGAGLLSLCRFKRKA
jgi:hypothetical protein